MDNGSSSRPPRCREPDIHPVWDTAFAAWGPAWTVHIVVFTVSFAVLAIYSSSILCVLSWRRWTASKRCRSDEDALTKRLFALRVALHSMVFVACFARTLSLGIDPYGTRAIMICPSGVVIWALGWPSLVASFSILLLLLLETTRLTLAPSRIQRPSVLGGIIAVWLGCVLLSTLLVAYDSHAKHAITFSKLFTITWGFAITCGFVFVWWKIRGNLSASSRGQTSMTARGGGDASGARDTRLRKLNAIIIVSALIGVFITVGNLIWFSGSLAKAFRSEAIRPWPWLVFHTTQRLLEVAISVTIMLTVSQSSRSRRVESATEPQYDMNDIAKTLP